MTRAKPVKPSEAEPEQRDVKVLDQVVDKADVKVQVENMHPGNFTGPGPQHRTCSWPRAKPVQASSESKGHQQWPAELHGEQPAKVAVRSGGAVNRTLPG